MSSNKYLVPTIGSLILNISSFTTRRISQTTASEYCCEPCSHIQTDNDPTRLFSRVGIWDRAFSLLRIMQLITSRSCVVSSIEEEICIRFSSAKAHAFMTSIYIRQK